jgi:phosphate transport system substrate-binding protein
LKGLTMQQVDSIFSSTYKRGGSPIDKWGQVGLTGQWAGKPMSLYGRNSASGTYGFFKDHALETGDFKPTVKEQPGSSSAVQGIGSDLAGIGYSGIGYLTSEVRALPLAGEGDGFVEATPENALSGDYPLARFLYVYINKKPNEPADKLVAEFVKFIASREGQLIVVKDGYFPIPASVATEVRESVSK